MTSPSRPTVPWHLSPFVSADYARVEVDGYSEKGASATALDYDDQKRSSKRLGAGLQGKYAFGGDTQLFAEYAHEREYEDDTQDLTMSLNSLPGNRFTLEGYTRRTISTASHSASARSWRRSARGGYNWRKGEDDTQQSVSLALSLTSETAAGARAGRVPVDGTIGARRHQESSPLLLAARSTAIHCRSVSFEGIAR